MRIFFKIYSLLFVLLPFVIHTQDVVLNELISSNRSTIMDEDGDFPDWIEIYNVGTSPAQLGTFFLSDDSTELLKWQIPQVSLAAKDHLLLFASGKDRKNAVLHWEDAIRWGDSCYYKIPDAATGNSWINPDYNHNSWQQGKTGIGYGDGDDSTTIAHTICVYARIPFFIDNRADISDAVFHLDYDDAFVAYLNGIEIARSGVGIPGDRPAYNAFAETLHEAQIYTGGAPEQFTFDSARTILKEGINILAVEVHNFNVESSDLTLIPFLTLGMKSKPVNSRGSHPLLDLPESLLHTNFKLSSGENLFLTRSDSAIIDHVILPFVDPDVSIGRMPDGTGTWYFFDQPTPGSANGTDGRIGAGGKVSASQQGGFFATGVALNLSSDSPADTIYYSLDGSDPNFSSSIFNANIFIDTTTVIKARILSKNKLPGPILNQIYLIGEETDLPVLSLSTDPPNLWDYHDGIYVLGPNAESADPHFGANFWQDWEKPAHVEFFDNDKNKGFSEGCGIKIYGAWSRAHPLKSLSVFFRNSYGASQLDYTLFPEQDVQSYESFVLRNSGNDYPSTYLRDGMMQNLVANMGIDRQEYQPAVVFLNGVYWGIHNIREKISEHFISSKHGVGPQKIDMLENDKAIIHGSNEHYENMMGYINTHDMSLDESYEHISKQMDVDEYIKYQISQIFFDNTDWPGNNLKYWRPATSTGKWRWILYDTDFGFGMYDHSAYNHNTLEFALAENGPDWPNPPWSTLLLRKLLENATFKNKFINYFADHLNTTFSASNVLNEISIARENILQEMPRHLQRWQQSYDNWENEIERLRLFARNRTLKVYMHIMTRFDLSGLNWINISVNDSIAGSNDINSINISEPSWKGKYFSEIPIFVKARPKAGYKFSHWSGDTTSSFQELTLTLSSTFNLQANFEESVEEESIVINEINYNSSQDFDTDDWIELCNAGQDPIDVTGWILKDEDDSHFFRFPFNTILEPDSYLVVARDESKLRTFFAYDFQIAGEMNFGLSGSGEVVRLFNADNIIIDSVLYDDNDPWPAKADGDGATLELINPGRDNNDPLNWQASAVYGTPGRINSAYTYISDDRTIIIPEKTELGQNYPNPFNPETVISYQVGANRGSPAHVALIIYNLLGQKITSLVSEKQTAGVYTYSWKAEIHLASGIYFYQLIVDGKIVQSKKMILIQ